MAKLQENYDIAVVADNKELTEELDQCKKAYNEQETMIGFLMRKNEELQTKLRQLTAKSAKLLLTQLPITQKKES